MTTIIAIQLRDIVSGKEVIIEVPTNVQIKSLLPEISIALGNRNINDYQQLQNKTQGFDYAATDTLASKNTQPNDLCILKYETVQG